MQDFGNSTAVVTGGGSGIGRALARRFATEGANVVIGDIEPDAATETAGLITADSPGSGVLTHHTDVSDAESVAALADAAFERFGQVDVLCNNAGVFVGGFLWERPPADIEFVLGVNLWGILHGIRAFVPRMIAQGTDGHIVNTVSIAGLLGSGYSGPYSISKFAALAATESLAGDLAAVGSRIGVSALCPGVISTNIAKSHRNRPDHLATTSTDDQAFVDSMLDEVVPAGLDPAVVAGLVVDGIRARDFLILTHEHHTADIIRRASELAARQLPSLADFT